MNVLGRHLHIGHHAMHYLCAVAVVAVIAAVVLDAPVLRAPGRPVLRGDDDRHGVDDGRDGGQAPPLAGAQRSSSGHRASAAPSS